MSQALECYKILEVKANAPREDVVSSYKRLCRIYHPDVSGDPASEEQMKQINMAYSFLCGVWSGEESGRSRSAAGSAYAGPRKNPETAATGAGEVVEKYFRALMDSAYARAYSLLSDYDKREVSFEGFREWRKSVEQLFTITDYAVTENGVSSSVTLKNGGRLSAKKCAVAITEKNLISGKPQHDNLIKIAVLERGQWHVFLGYRDLNTISHSFKTLREEKLRTEMESRWRQWRADNCAELDILSVPGFLKQARRELYGYRRYKRPFVLAAFDVKPPPGAADGAERIMRSAAGAVTSALRETDIAAYAGEGVIIVLFAEMKKRYAAPVTKRLVGKLEKRVLDELGESVSVATAFAPYRGGHLQREVEALIRAIAT